MVPRRPVARPSVETGPEEEAGPWKSQAWAVRERRKERPGRKAASPLLGRMLSAAITAGAADLEDGPRTRPTGLAMFGR